jgi:hypothetical protein
MRLHDLFVKAGCHRRGGGAGFRLIGWPFPSKLALAGYALVRFGNALDPVLKLAAPLRQLLGYDVAGTGGSSIRKTCGERDSLTGSKLVFCHSATFPAHACGPGTPRALVSTADRIYHPGKAAQKPGTPPMR